MPVTCGTVVSARPALAMPDQIGGPRRIARAPGTAQRTVLLTGASGVVGHALLRRLRARSRARRPRTDRNWYGLVHDHGAGRPGSGNVSGPTDSLEESNHAF